MRKTILAIATGVLAAAVAGCADDGDDSGAGAAPATSAVTSGAPETPTSRPATTAASSAPSTSTSTSSSEGSGDVELGQGIVEEVLTPVVGQVTNAPSPVLGTDRRIYLAYELLLINATTTPVVLDSVTALDSDTGAELQEHTGDDLVGHSRVIGAVPSEDGTAEVRLAGGQAAVVSPIRRSRRAPRSRPTWSTSWR